MTTTRKQVDEQRAKFKEERPDGLGYNLEKFDPAINNQTKLKHDNLVPSENPGMVDSKFFVCDLCNNLVKDPLECNGCKSLFCSDCISTYR